MKKILSILLILTIALGLTSCGNKFSKEKEALTGSKWFSGEETSNTIVVWNFYDESVEKAAYFVDGNGMHDSEKKVAEYTIQKDAVKVVFDNEEMLIPYIYEDGKITLEKGKFFSPQDVDEAIQGFWTLRTTSNFFGTSSSNEYNIQFENGIMRIEDAAEAFNGAPGEYYYYGPYEGSYTIGDGTFETDAKRGDNYFFNVYDGKVNVLHYGNEMKRGDGLPGEDGYIFN